VTRVEVVVFDVGGTTVEDTADVADVFRTALAQYHIAAPPEKLRAWRGTSKRDVIEKLVKARVGADAEPSEVYLTFQTLLIDAFLTRGVRAIPGVEATFVTLHEHQVRPVLVTGFDREVVGVIIKHLGWENIVDAVVTSDDVLRGRPEPDLILDAMRRVGVTDPKAVVTVGDTVNDLLAAAAAGVGVSISVLTGAHDRSQLEQVPHTVILQSAADVVQWLADRDWSAA
jgi:phosphonatase-like hydrolase